jgi:hypothetical protein
MSTVHIENMGLSRVRATAGDRMNALGLCITGPWGAALGRAGPISYRQQHLESEPCASTKQHSGAGPGGRGVVIQPGGLHCGRADPAICLL